jgi:hypothetical protein
MFLLVLLFIALHIKCVIIIEQISQQVEVIKISNFKEFKNLSTLKSNTYKFRLFKKGLKFKLLLFFLFSKISFASTFTLESKIDDLKKEEEKPQNEKLLDLKYFSEGFFTPNEYGENQVYHVLEVKPKLENFTKTFHTKVEGRFGFGLNSINDYQYYAVPEAFLETQNPNLNFSFGRKIENWSELDESWMLGLFNPRFRWNYFDPQEQGLTGLFVNYQTKSLQFKTLLSALYLPEQGPGYELKDGVFSSGSPYFQPPTNTVKVFDQSTSVYYNVQMPSIASIVLKPSFATSLKLKNEQGFGFRLGYAYKPMNQIGLGVDGKLNLSTLEAQVTAHPFVRYHELVSLDLLFEEPKDNDLNLNLSGVLELPKEASNVSQSWTIANSKPALITDLGVESKIIKTSKDSLKASLHYLKRQGGDALDSGPMANSTQSFFESRFPYKDALSFGIKGPMFGILERKINFKQSFVYELRNLSLASITRVNFQLTKDISLFTGAELLSSSPQTKTIGFDSDMISQNRSNDRVFGGISYVF